MVCLKQEFLNPWCFQKPDVNGNGVQSDTPEVVKSAHGRGMKSCESVSQVLGVFAVSAGPQTRQQMRTRIKK